LSEFLARSMQAYPARRYAVLLREQDSLAAQPVQQALQQARQRSGRDIDLIALDSAAMQQAEIAYTLRNEAQVMVAPQARLSDQAFPYEETLAILKQNPKISAPQLGSQIVQQQAQKSPRSVQTAVDLQAQPALSAALKKAVDTLIQEKVPVELIYTSMMRVRPIEAQDPSQPAFDLRDLPSFLSHLAEDPRLTSEAAQAALREALEAQQQTLLAHHNGPQAAGKRPRKQCFSALAGSHW
jgi:hypothetical protein